MEAQTFQWAKSFNCTSNEEGVSIATDADGNVYSIGTYWSGVTIDFDPGPGIYNLPGLGADDIYISKLDKNGIFVWAKVFGSTSNFDHPTSIITDQIGNLYITGDYQGTCDFDPGPGVFNLTASSWEDFILKLDTAGNFIWAVKTEGYGNSVAYADDFTLDTFGNIYLAGRFNNTIDVNPGPGVYNLTEANGRHFILKLNSSGGFVWARQFSVVGVLPNGICADQNGSICVTGKFSGTSDFDPGPGIYNLTSNGLSDIFVYSIDFNGNFLWAKNFGSPTYDESFSVCTDLSGNKYLTGFFTGTVDFDPGPGTYNLVSVGNSSMFTLKLNTTGAFIWAKTISGSWGHCVNTDSIGNVFIQGSSNASTDFDPGLSQYILTPNGLCFYVLKLDSNGNFIHVETIGNETEIWCSDMTVDNLGNVYTTGHHNGNGDFDPSAGSYILNSVNDDIFISKILFCGTHYYTGNSGCDSVDFIGSTFYLDTSFVQFFNTADGCDSNYITDIIVHHLVNDTLNIMSCGPYFFNGMQCDSTGIYLQNYSTVFGCDSTVVLNLTVNDSSSFIINDTACASYLINGITYTSSGNYTQLYTNAVGCDSVLMLNLVIYPASTTTINQTACDSFSLNGISYLYSGQFTQMFTNAAGCDSIVALNLMIDTIYAIALNATACGTYTWNGQTFTNSGSYTQFYTSMYGCDSTMTLNLTINNANTIVLQNGPLLHADANIAAWQWITCNPYQVLPGETNQDFTATMNGDYAVIVTEVGCTDTSACYTVSGFGLNEEMQNTVSIFPNPVSGILQIRSGILLNGISITLLSTEGKTIMEKKYQSGRNFNLELSQAAKGIYFIRVESDGMKFVRKVVKE